jgi:hypothetical protein
MHIICTTMDVRCENIYHNYMIMQSVMYCNIVDGISDIVFVTFLIST